MSFYNAKAVLHIYNSANPPILVWAFHSAQGLRALLLSLSRYESPFDPNKLHCLSSNTQNVFDYHKHCFLFTKKPTSHYYKSHVSINIRLKKDARNYSGYNNEKYI